MPSRRYDAPSEKFGRHFVETLWGGLRRVRDRKWESERFIVFHTAILQRARHVTASHSIRQWIGKRLGAWEAGSHRMLMEDTLCTCAQYLTAAHREESKEHRSQNFHSLVLQGKLQKAVWWITERDMGGVLKPARSCTNMGERVMKVLCTKHPEACPPTVSSLDSYQDCPPEFVPVGITDNTVTVVAERISGGAGMGGTDSVSLQHWLLRFGASSGGLWMIVAVFRSGLEMGGPHGPPIKPWWEAGWLHCTSSQGSEQLGLEKLVEYWWQSDLFGWQEGGEGHLRDGTTGRWRGGGDRRRHSRHACPLEGVFTVRGLEVSPNWCAELIQWGEPDSNALGCP